jgi:hypothetical protein
LLIPIPGFCRILKAHELPSSLLPLKRYLHDLSPTVALGINSLAHEPKEGIFKPYPNYSNSQIKFNMPETVLRDIPSK